MLVLQAKQGERLAKQVRKVVQQDEPVAQDRQVDSLQVIELHGDPLGESADDLLAHGGPADAVGGATGHVVDVYVIGDGYKLLRERGEGGI